jgi:NTE family protein
MPPLFRAVRTRGTFCWDGLFSRNPPIRGLTNLRPPPDEIWIVRINPQH